jgi:hypothetical protein
MTDRKTPAKTHSEAEERAAELRNVEELISVPPWADCYDMRGDCDDSLAAFKRVFAYDSDGDALHTPLDVHDAGGGWVRVEFIDSAGMHHDRTFKRHASECVWAAANMLVELGYWGVIFTPLGIRAFLDAPVWAD